MFRIDEGRGEDTRCTERHKYLSWYVDDEKVDVIQDTCGSHMRLIIGFLILPT
jgi:hypothetical protein